MMTFCPCPQLNNNARGKINSFSTRVSGRYRIDVRRELKQQSQFDWTNATCDTVFPSPKYRGLGLYCSSLVRHYSVLSSSRPKRIIRIRSSLFTCTSIFLLQKVSNKKYLAYFVSDILPREKQITEIFDLWNIFSSYCVLERCFSPIGV